MRNRLAGVAFAVTGVLAFSVFLFAQSAQKPSTTKTEAGASALDLSGVWTSKDCIRDAACADPKADPYRDSKSAGAASGGKPAGYRPDPVPDAGSGFTDGPFPMQPWVEWLYKESFDFEGHERPDPLKECNPQGPILPGTFEIIQSPRRVFVFYESNQVRQIWLDGRQHPKGDELEHTWTGDSIGHWEGDTLVVDTVGLNDKTSIAGHAHSDQLHLIEHIRRPDPASLTVQTTVDDPKAYTRTFTSKVKAWGLKPNWDIPEYIRCEDHLRGDIVQGFQ